MFVTASCRFPYLEEWKSFCEKNKICAFVDSILSGYAQIAFSDNSFSAVILIIATWIGSPVQCICALWSTFLCTFFAYALRIPRDLIRSGLYGFNGALSGLAIPIVLFAGQGLSLQMLSVCTIASALCVLFTTSLRRFFGKWNVPALSSPYCISVSILLLASLFLGTTLHTPVGANDLLMATPCSDWTTGDFLFAAANGASQVLWVEKPLCGILYILAVILSSRIDAVNTLIAIFVSTGISVLLGLPKDAVMIGIYGFNSVLLMKVVGRGFLITRKTQIFNIMMAAVMPVICVLFKIILSLAGINTLLAFPYATTCIVIFLLQKKLYSFTYVPAKYWGVPETINKK